MPANLVSRIDLDKLYPPFLRRLLELLADCRRAGADYYAVSGFRSYAEQTALYEQGRTRPGLRVTNARAGESAHNFGLAVDLVRDGVLDRRGLQPDWSPESYVPLGERAPKFGLLWGGEFLTPDYPHVQWPGYATASQLAPLRDIFERAGLRAVWEYLDDSG